MPDFTARFRVPPRTAIKLSKIATDDTAGIDSKQAANGRLQHNITRLAALQYRLAAENKRALLIILQAMDAGGKDGTIRHVMSGLNPQGCRVVPFKVPAGAETAHDFLWRIHHNVPAFGEIGIFNRSQYEDVLVVRVHDLVPKAVWSRRYEQINAFEKMLADNGTTILKFFLHISRDEQKRRLEARIDDPSKNWKIVPSDLSERKYWQDYQDAYQDAIRNCSTEWAPWFVIPADRKWFRNLVVSEIIADTLAAMKLRTPKPAMDLSKVTFD
ncbi:MAG TPA: polyphosphate kinase 2 family protein [Bryobacteraceae bacterium]|nr:polyphosphate kinase 2 family protein [Bryobacteraceae bacterium]